MKIKILVAQTATDLVDVPTVFSADSKETFSYDDGLIVGQICSMCRLDIVYTGQLSHKRFLNSLRCIRSCALVH